MLWGLDWESYWSSWRCGTFVGLTEIWGESDISFRCCFCCNTWYNPPWNSITWYNPPWNSNVKTNLGRKFLLVVDKCFPKNHPLNKIFNRHMLKLSYSCMPNMKAVISSHNKNMLTQDHGATAAPVQQPRTCNCKNKPKCPLQGNCVKENVVYQATVATETTTETYVGLASNFKERYRNHQTSFRHRSKRNETELSKYIWDLKDRKKSFHVKWRILRSCQPYSNVNQEVQSVPSRKVFYYF